MASYFLASFCVLVAWIGSRKSPIWTCISREGTLCLLPALQHFRNIYLPESVVICVWLGKYVAALVVQRPWTESKFHGVLCVCLDISKIATCSSSLSKHRFVLLNGQIFCFHRDRRVWAHHAVVLVYSSNDFIWIHIVPVQAWCLVALNWAVFVERRQRKIFILDHYGTILSNLSYLLLGCSDGLGYSHVRIARVIIVFLSGCLNNNSLFPLRGPPAFCLLLTLCLLHKLNNVRLHWGLAPSSPCEGRLESEIFWRFPVLGLFDFWDEILDVCIWVLSIFCVQ